MHPICTEQGFRPIKAGKLGLARSRCTGGLFYRHLTIDEVLARQRARHVREIAAHNAAVTADSAARRGLREQVLEEFGGLSRRWAKAL